MVAPSLSCPFYVWWSDDPRRVGSAITTSRSLPERHHKHLGPWISGLPWSLSWTVIQCVERFAQSWPHCGPISTPLQQPGIWVPLPNLNDKPWIFFLHPWPPLSFLQPPSLQVTSQPVAATFPHPPPPSLSLSGFPHFSLSSGLSA